MFRTKKFWLIGLAAFLGTCLLLLVIGALASGGDKATGDVAEVSLATGVTSAAKPTRTTAPTKTTRPTRTLLPTFTERPEPTSTLVPTARPPLLFEGTGAQVVDMDWGGQPAIVHVVYKGSSYFGVTSHDANNEQIALLVNTVGSYDGVVPLDLHDSDYTRRLVVDASGPWTIEVKPVTDIDILRVPGTIEGSGDYMFALKGGSPDIAKITSASDAYFGVEGYSQSSGHDLLVNEVGAYSGTVLLTRDTFLMIVTADGPWSIEVTAQ